jgi:paraquat-inducible protein B
MRKLLMLGITIILLINCQSQTMKIKIHFNRLSGLAPGDRVLFKDNAAGAVDSIHYNKDGSYEVRLHVNEGYSHAATEHTRFRIVEDTDRSGHQAVDMMLSQQGGAPLSNGAVVRGDDSMETFWDQLNKRIEEGFAFFQKQMERLAEDMKQVPNSEAYRNLKKSLSDMADELGRTEKQARKKLKEEWLPRFEKELDELERKLREYGREREAEPLKEEISRIRKI